MQEKLLEWFFRKYIYKDWECKSKSVIFKLQAFVPGCNSRNIRQYFKIFLKILQYFELSEMFLNNNNFYNSLKIFEYFKIFLQNSECSQLFQK